MHTKLAKVVNYYEKLPPTKLHNLLNTMSVTTIPDSIDTYNNEIPQSEEPLITWSGKVIRKFKYVISLLPCDKSRKTFYFTTQCLELQNIGVW